MPQATRRFLNVRQPIGLTWLSPTLKYEDAGGSPVEVGGYFAKALAEGYKASAELKFELLVAKDGGMLVQPVLVLTKK